VHRLLPPLPILSAGLFVNNPARRGSSKGKHTGRASQIITGAFTINKIKKIHLIERIIYYKHRTFSAGITTVTNKQLQDK
jgi:hypothetical protein